LPSAAALEATFAPWSSDNSEAARSGISLASSRAAISEIGGTIDVRSGETTGTVFIIRVPLARAAGLSPAAQRAAAITILVVDDDEVARDLIVGALSNAHFTVLSAADGARAVELVREHDDVINLLVTDVVMPRLNGPRVAEILRERHPKMRVLYLSGYTDGVDLPINAPGAPSAFLAKPFTRGTLVARVQALLDK
jgi:CheY-like chemotaxis protein